MFVGCRRADIFLSLHSREAVSETEMGRSNARNKRRTANDNEHEHEHARMHARTRARARAHTHTRTQTHYGLALSPGEFLRNKQRLLVGRRAVRPWLLVKARQQRGPERPAGKQGGGNNDGQSVIWVLHNDVCSCPRAHQRARHQLTRWPVQSTCHSCRPGIDFADLHVQFNDSFIQVCF